MEYFETELLPLVQNGPSMWLRYVDDVFSVWPEGRDFDSFFHDLNGTAQTIKFTVEWESDCRLPFLDVNVHRFQSEFRFSVYRKPTHSGVYLHYFSWQPQQVKFTIFYSLFLRAYRLCNSMFLNDEISF